MRGNVDSSAICVFRNPEAFSSPITMRPATTWFVRDQRAMAKALDWGEVAPFYVDQESPVPAGGVPKPGPLKPQLRNDHLGYALTWFGLAAGLAVCFRGLGRLAAAEKGLKPRASRAFSTKAMLYGIISSEAFVCYYFMRNMASFHENTRPPTHTTPSLKRRPLSPRRRFAPPTGWLSRTMHWRKSSACPSRQSRGCAGGAYVLDSGNKAFELALLFVRLYRSLDSIVDGDDDVARSWINNDNSALRGTAA